MPYKSPIILNKSDLIYIDQELIISGKNKGSVFDKKQKNFNVQDNIFLYKNHQKYKLIQYHFHIPSEHKLKDEKYPAEIHYVFIQLNEGYHEEENQEGNHEHEEENQEGNYEENYQEGNHEHEQENQEGNYEENYKEGNHDHEEENQEGNYEEENHEGNNEEKNHEEEIHEEGIYEEESHEKCVKYGRRYRRHSCESRHSSCSESDSDYSSGCSSDSIIGCNLDVCCGSIYDMYRGFSNILVIGKLIENYEYYINALDLIHNSFIDLTKIQCTAPNKYFEYDGTLTTGTFDPVRWIIDDDVLKLDVKKLRRFAKTAREVQLLDGRIILFKN